MFKKKKKLVEGSADPTNPKNIFEEGQDWEISKRIMLQKSLKRAWIFAGMFCGTTVLATIALIGLTPLKQVQLEIIRVDSSTGIVEVLEQQKEFKTNYEETINTYFIKQYIRYREGYSYELMSDYYNYVGLMSTPEEQQQYARWFSPKNPSSPLKKYGTNKRATIQFKSMTYLAEDVALVRFTRESVLGMNDVTEEHLTATIRFKYVKGAISSKDKEINPLGFQVIEYRIDEDATVKKGGN